MRKELLVAQLCLSLLLPHGLQPAKLLCLWGFSGKNTVVGSHFFLQGIFLIYDPTDCSLPGSSSVRGIFQARVLEWGVIAFSDDYIYDYIYIYIYTHTYQIRSDQSLSRVRLFATP